MRRIVAWVVTIAVLLAGCGGQVVEAPTPTEASLGITLAPPTPSPTLAVTPTDTPAPTATPAPTPTPIIYIVQAGDTLLGIALKFGVTVAVIQQTNGIINPQSLQIGQELIIPFESGSGEGGHALLATPTPLPVTVQGVSLYETAVGSLWGLGEVVNGGRESLENVQVRIALVSDTGQELAFGMPFTVLDVVPPGGKSPFGLLFTAPPGRFASFHAVIVRAEPSIEPGGRYARLKVAESHGGTDGSQFRVLGIVRNDDRQNVRDIKVVVTAYDATGKVTGYRQQSFDELAAGKELEFSVSFAPSGGTPAGYAVAAEARFATE
jgi:LysM repeat protein